jgi:DNA-binding NarL/FixJ family response regulator
MTPAQESATYLDRARGDAALRQFFATPSRRANGVSMVVEAEDGASAEAHAPHTDPHVAVFDNHMPRLSGIDAALPLRKLQPVLPLNSTVR